MGRRKTITQKKNRIMKKWLKILPIAIVLMVGMAGCESGPAMFTDVEVRLYNSTSRPVSFSAYMDGDYRDNGNPIVKVYAGDASSLIIDRAYARRGSIVNIHLCSPYNSAVVMDYAVVIEDGYVEVEVVGPSYSPSVYINGTLVY